MIAGYLKEIHREGEKINLVAHGFASCVTLPSPRSKTCTFSAALLWK